VKQTQFNSTLLGRPERIFFGSTREGWQSIGFVIDFRYVDPLQIYSLQQFFFQRGSKIGL